MNNLKSNKPKKITDLVVVAKFDDGKCRQILLKKNTQECLLSLINLCERKINVLDEIIEGIDIN